MTASEPPAPQPFVPVSETVRLRGERSWLGEGWSRTDLLWLAAITLVGTALRLWNLEQWPLSAAEADTWRGATEALGGATGFLASQRSHAPLPFLGLRGLFELGVLPSHGEGWLRLPFVFPGILTVPLLALVGDLFVARRAALFAAALLALHPWHVGASQTASGEVAVGFFGVFAAGVGVVAHRMRDRRFGLLALVLAVAAAGCHPSGWGAVVGLGAGSLLARERLAGRVRTAVLGALLLVLGAAAAAYAASGAETAAASPPVPLLAIAMAARPAVLVLAVLGGVAAAAAGIGGVGRRWLAVAAWLPIGLTVGLAAFGLPVTSTHALVALPALVALAALGALRWFDLVGKALGGAGRLAVRVPAALVPVVLGFDLAVETFLYANVHAGHRADWRQASDFVLDTAARGRPLVVLAGDGVPSLTYYLRPNHWRDLAVDAHPGIAVRTVPLHDFTAEAAFVAAARADRDVFLVLRRAEVAVLQRHPAGQELLARAFHTAAVVPCPSAASDSTIYVYRALPAEPR